MFESYKIKSAQNEKYYDQKEFERTVSSCGKLIEHIVGEIFNNFHIELKTPDERIRFFGFEKKSGPEYISFIKRPTIGVSIRYYKQLASIFPDHPRINQDIIGDFNTINTLRNKVSHAGGQINDSDAFNAIMASRKILNKLRMLDLMQDTIGIPLRTYLIYGSIIEKFKESVDESDFEKVVVDAKILLPEMLNLLINKKYPEITIDQKKIFVDQISSFGECYLDFNACRSFFYDSDFFPYFGKKSSDLKNALEYIHSLDDQYTRLGSRPYITALKVLFDDLKIDGSDYFFKLVNNIKKFYLDDEKIDDAESKTLRDNARLLNFDQASLENLKQQVVNEIKSLQKYRTLIPSIKFAQDDSGAEKYLIEMIQLGTPLSGVKVMALRNNFQGNIEELFTQFSTMEVGESAQVTNNVVVKIEMSGNRYNALDIYGNKYTSDIPTSTRKGAFETGMALEKREGKDGRSYWWKVPMSKFELSAPVMGMSGIDVPVEKTADPVNVKESTIRTPHKQQLNILQNINIDGYKIEGKNVSQIYENALSFIINKYNIKEKLDDQFLTRYFKDSENKFNSSTLKYKKVREHEGVYFSIYFSSNDKIKRLNQICNYLNLTLINDTTDLTKENVEELFSQHAPSVEETEKVKTLSEQQSKDLKISFEPGLITKEHVLSAIKRINDESIKLKKSTKFNLEVNGVLYPPKEVMRYAHEEMNGQHIWQRSGVEPTNKVLKKLGFTITQMSDDDSKESNVEPLDKKFAKTFYDDFDLMIKHLNEKSKISEKTDEMLTYVYDYLHKNASNDILFKFSPSFLGIRKDGKNYLVIKSGKSFVDIDHCQDEEGVKYLENYGLEIRPNSDKRFKSYIVRFKELSEFKQCQDAIVDYMNS